MLPGFFLTFLYLVYILGWAIINPKIAPKLPPDQYRVNVPDYLTRLERGTARRVVGGVLTAAFRPALAAGPDGRPVGYRVIAHNLLILSVPVLLTFGTFAATWWYVVIYNAPEAATAAAPAARPSAASAPAAPAEVQTAKASAPAEEKPQELGAAGESESESASARTAAGPEEMTSLRDTTTASEAGRFRRTSTPGSGGSRPRRPFYCSSTSGAWTASSSRS